MHETNISGQAARDRDAQMVLVTGPGGAGRTTAIRSLEDIGYETIDNMPLTLLPRLLTGAPPERPLALGVDVRNRDFSVATLNETLDLVAADPSMVSELLFLNARPEVLVRRYSETRRRHPLAPDDAPSLGVDRETALLDPIRDRADILIDTSEMTPHDLKAEIGRWFGGKTGTKMSVSVQSFSYKRGVPNGLDMVLDCRFLRNPHWQPDLRASTGRDAVVATYVQQDPNYAAFFQRSVELVLLLLPAYLNEGKSHFALGFGCTGGKHRSVAVTEAVVKALAESGWRVSKRHRELERTADGVSVARIGGSV
ncbi:MAG: RNase adapter RapZ [Pseudomonadota bacterium]